MVRVEGLQCELAQQNFRPCHLDVLVERHCHVENETSHSVRPLGCFQQRATVLPANVLISAAHLGVVSSSAAPLVAALALEQQAAEACLEVLALFQWPMGLLKS